MNAASHRKSLYVAGAVLTTCLATPLFASAFAPKQLHEVWGVIGRSHARQTADGVRAVVQQLYRSPTVSRTTELAIEEMAAANADIDMGVHKEDGRYHFDGEMFAEAQAVLSTAVRNIVYGLNNNRVEAARWQLGGALHTLQDFYSHSNWIEQRNTRPHPQVGRGVTIANTASRSEDTCVDCINHNNECPDCSNDLTTQKLTTGYYGGQTDNERPVGPAKCSHGGSRDKEATGGDAANPSSGINKDTKVCDLSPHAWLHPTAAMVATDATKQFILDLKEKISEDELMQLLGIGPSVATVLDVSGSMEVVWKALADHMDRLIASRVGTPNEISKFVLVPFSDPYVGWPTITSDPKAFLGAIRSASVSRGNDCPELAIGGLEKAIHASDLGGAVFLFTDADAKDQARADAVIANARRRGIEIYAAILGTCDGANPSMAPVRPSAVYRRLTRETGGQAFTATKEGVGQVLQVIDELSRSGNTALAKAVRPASAVGNKAVGAPLQVPVDATITRLAVVVTGTSDVHVLRPSGAELGDADPGVEKLSMPEGVIVRIANPEPGTWTVSNPSAEADISVRADSPLGLVSASFVQSSGQGAHDGYFPIDGEPLVGKPQKVTVRLDGPVASANLELRGEAGDVLVQAALMADPEAAGEFFGELAPPAQPYVLHVTGTTSAGQTFQRSAQRVDQAQYLYVDAPHAVEATRGQALDYRFVLRNDGAADSFDVELFDDAGFLESPAKQTLQLAAGQSAEITARLTIAANAEVMSFHHLTLSASSTRDPSLRTGAVVKTMVLEATDAAPPEARKDESGCNLGARSDHGGSLALGLLLLALQRRRSAPR